MTSFLVSLGLILAALFALLGGKPHIADIPDIEEVRKEVVEDEELVVIREGFYLVTRVVDGDTFVVDMKGRIETIRLIGVDAPESVHPSKPVQCFGKEASVKLKELLEGKQVRLEEDATQDEKDRYGRLLRYVFLEDGSMVNKIIIEEGYAYEYTYAAPYQYQVEFKAAQRQARENKRGLWANGICIWEK